MILNCIVVLFLLISETVSADVALIDPMRPLNYSSSSAVIFSKSDAGQKQQDGWTVSMIRISSKGRTAIINEQLSRVGDTVDRAEVLEINPASILLEYAGRQIPITLFEGGMRKQKHN